MSRVTADEVILLTSTAISECIVNAWIGAATKIVDGISECVNNDETLTAIELQLSAHLIVMQDPTAGNSQVTSMKNEGTQTQFNAATLQGNINDTIYGRTANMLSDGCLIDVDKPLATVEFF
jgi:hypothetical protein